MTEQLPLNTSPLPVRLRVEDFLLLDGSGALDGYRKTELIDGEILFMNAQHRPHMKVKGELAFHLRLALERVGSNLYVGIEGGTRMSEHDMPEPDILLTSEPDGEGPVPGQSVALVVEVADTTLAFDLGRKAALYARAGIAEYWVADVSGRLIHQHWLPGAGEYHRKHAIPFNEQVTAATITGLSVPTTTL